MDRERFTKVIEDSRMKYVERHYPETIITYSDVNKTSSLLYASYVLEWVKKFRSTPVGYVSIGSTINICDENMFILDDNDIYNNIISSGIDIPREIIHNIKLPNYTWIYNEGLYYDIETPQGVNSIFKLPILNKIISAYKPIQYGNITEYNGIRIPFRIIQ